MVGLQLMSFQIHDFDDLIAVLWVSKLNSNSISRYVHAIGHVVRLAGIDREAADHFCQRMRLRRG